MRMWKALTFTALTFVAGCGGGGGTGGGSRPVAVGVAVKGPVAGASVEILALRPTGVLGEVLASGTTDANGNFEIRVNGTTGWVVARITGGTFVDEASGANATIPGDQPLLGFVNVESPSATAAVPAPIAITPVSTIAFALMQFLAHDPEATLQDDVENALAAAGRHFGLEDLRIFVPADLTSSATPAGPAADYGAVVAGISKLAEGASVDTMAMVTALAQDASDAHFDGNAYGVEVVLGAGTLMTGAGTSALGGAIVDFLASGGNASGLTAADTDVDDVLAASSGVFAKPVQLRGLASGYGLTSATVDAQLEATLIPPSPQVLIESQLVSITSQSLTSLGIEIPTGLALGLHDLVVRDGDTGLVARLRDAIEVFDPAATPTVSEVSPPAGPLTGGTFLELRGTNFGPDTVVEIDGVPAARLNEDLPRRLVVASPAHAAGAVGVTVSNSPQAEVTVANAFEYRASDARSNSSQPTPPGSIVFGAVRLFASTTNGITSQALFGRSTLNDFETGNFNLTDYIASQDDPVVETRHRSGTTFQSTESLGKAFLLFDSTNGLSDFVRGSTSEKNDVSLGATAFGPACFFATPSNVHVDTVARSYWVTGLETDITHSTLRQKSGWLELDASLHGSATFLVHGRDFGGTSFELAPETWDFDYVLTSDGAFQGVRAVEGGSATFDGHFNAGADLGFFLENRADEVIGFYWLTPVEHGVESGGWGGWTGGYLSNEIVDDGMGGDESAFASGSYRGLIAGTAVGYSRLAFNRETRMTESKPDSTFAEVVGATELDLSPSGRIFSGDTIAGYVNQESGILLTLGGFPNECVRGGGIDLPIASGGAVFRHSRKSYLSLEPTVTQVAIEARFLESGLTHPQELGTDLFDLALDADTPPSVSGIPIPLAGTIPKLAAASIAGFHKSSVRDASGTVTTTRGDPQPWGVTVGYSVIDDQLDLFATEITQPGRFDGADMPRWVASGKLANDGEVATLRSSDEFLGDATLYLVAQHGLTTSLPILPMKAMGLSFEPNAGGFSGVTSARTVLTFAGNGTVSTTAVSHTMSESGVFSSASSAGLGTNTAPGAQQVRITVPNGAAPDREWQTVWTPSGDAFFGIDDAPTTDTVEIVLGILPALGGSFLDDDHNLFALELNPQTSRATTQQLILTPRFGSLLTGELITSRRDASGHTLLPGQSFVSTASTDLGSGAARVPFVGQIPVLEFLFNQHQQAIGQEQLTLLITPRLIHSVDD